MAGQDISNSLTPEQQAFGKRVYDLIMNRVIKNVHDGLDEKNQKKMEEVFQGSDDKKKDKFAKKYFKDLDYLFLKEAKSVGEEISKSMGAQVI